MRSLFWTECENYLETEIDWLSQKPDWAGLAAVGMMKSSVWEKEKVNICPKCRAIEGQMKNGCNRSGTQTYICLHCKKTYTPEPKRNAYGEEVRSLAMKMYYSGVSGRGVGKILGMSKANVYNWIKKTKKPVDCFQIMELDELYWFIGQKARTETRENVYVMTMVSREPRQIVGFDVALDKSARHIQGIVDSAPEAKEYCTDGYYGYLDVIYPGLHIYNTRDKSNTFTVEGVNADLRHYIPLLARRCRCFARKLDTLRTALAVFDEAYNRFGVAKLKWRATHDKGEIPFAIVDFL